MRFNETNPLWITSCVKKIFGKKRNTTIAPANPTKTYRRLRLREIPETPNSLPSKAERSWLDTPQRLLRQPVSLSW